MGPRLNLAPKSEHRSAHQGHDDKLGGEPDGGPDGLLEDLLDDVNVELAAHVHRVDDHHQHQYQREYAVQGPAGSITLGVRSC